MTDPVVTVTDETLHDIEVNGVWAGGLTFSPAVLSVSRALLATLQGAADGVLPAELQQAVNDVRATATIDFPRFTAHDGVRLSAFIVKLNTSTPCPLVVVPAGWSPYGWLPFLWTYLTLAADGYHVMAYTPRGLGDPDLPSTSEGYIDVGGPNDWADGSTVLDYAEEFGPSTIGILGESYGSGIGQLVAAHDPADRVAAVVALSTWGNLATSLYANGTRHLAAMRGLVGFTGGTREEKFDAETRRILDDFEQNRNMDEVVAWGTERSPETYIDITNARGIPTFMSNTWHETLFPVNELLHTFTQLTVPKRLNMWIGDHGAPEGAGLVGVPTGTAFPGLLTPMREARDWLRVHLRGGQAAYPDEVSNQIMFTYRTQPVSGERDRITVPARRESHKSWADVTLRTERRYLGNATGDGELGSTQSIGWTRDFLAGGLTAATAADPVLLSTGQQEWYGNPKPYRLDEFERDRLLIWLTEPLAGGRGLRGAPRLRLTVRSTANEATLVAYLFDVAPDNTARLITHEPYTLADLAPDDNRTIEWQLQAACYDVSDGHRLALVLNSRDPLYSFVRTDSLSTTTISSPTDTESYLDLPLG
ncbi:CocE/NonD family hydrolase [Nocardia blacklockiae]|uniref:CocE/NonD family hydrolase n=1 Tax=Nocardia blacklockiae TaxID=480036 RepID=UPI0018933DDA|nr:CocE/NonD family hydrolase [Nocardia blacklockiae]MBF6173101.1 hypothetical protein [Nocardia blacklockiae]